MKLMFNDLQKNILFKMTDWVLKSIKDRNNKDKVKKIKNQFTSNQLIAQLKKDQIGFLLVIVDRAIVYDKKNPGQADKKISEELPKIKHKLAESLTEMKKEEEKNAVQTESHKPE